MRFNITYEIVTNESAEHGDLAESGFIAKDIESLREALDHFNGYGCHIEGQSYPANGCDWITAYDTNEGTREWYETDRRESRSLHFPDNMTNASRNRLMRLLGVYGIDKS